MRLQRFSCSFGQCSALPILLMACFMMAWVKGEEDKSETAKDTVAVEAPKEVFVRANGVELFTKQMGEGEPVIVLHGGPGMHHDYFLPQMSPLSKSFKLILYDQRATGRSKGKATKETINVETFVKDLDELRKALGFKKVHLMGHSWGGLLSLHYALKHPQHVHSIVLIGTAPATSRFWLEFSRNINDNLNAEDHKALFALAQTDAYKKREPESLELHDKIIYKAYLFDATMISQLTTRVPIGSAVNGRKVWSLLYYNDLKNYNLYDRLETLRCRTLIIHGQDDPLPIKYSQAIHKHIKNSKLLELEKCGHYPYIEHPKIFQAAVTEFMENKERETQKRSNAIDSD